MEDGNLKNETDSNSDEIKAEMNSMLDAMISRDDDIDEVESMDNIEITRREYVAMWTMMVFVLSFFVILLTLMTNS